MVDELIWDFLKGYRIVLVVVQGFRGYFFLYIYFFSFFLVCKMVNIISNFLGRRFKFSNGVGDNEVDFMGVGLSGYIVVGGEVEFFVEKFVQFVVFFRVFVEQFEERSLCISGILGVMEFEFIVNLFDVVKIKY